ncbi:hypothetical protein Tco_0450648 [Tanacetum coccineum]
MIVMMKKTILENDIDHSVTNLDKHEIHNEVDNISVVPSYASFALNDVCVSSDNYVFIPHDPIATELKIYKEQVDIYEQRAKFELTEREQRMDDQMHIVIQNHNKMKENLKKKTSTSTSQTTQEEQSHVIPTSVKEDDLGIEVAHMDNDL